MKVLVHSALFFLLPYYIEFCVSVVHESCWFPFLLMSKTLN
jgi:hypothetical protein